jgi:hypothetical protein
VLVVGVNNPVAAKAYTLLSEAGIDVLSAGDTARALEVCRWSLRPIDVLLSCDHLMDESTLQQLQSAAASIQPRLQCIRLTTAEASDRHLLIQRVRHAASKLVFSAPESAL